MKIKGLQKLTLLDYPGKVACTVFLGGCDFRCPYCHNMDIVLDSYPQDYIDSGYFFDFLRKRRSMLEGVCITGGEPLMSAEVEDFIRSIKELGYSVKLDTNGSYPERLKELVAKGLVDYVALDIKHSPEKYALAAGCTPPLLEKVKESVDFLMNGSLPYEFRTTVAKPLHTLSDFDSIGEWIKGDSPYFLQCFASRETVPDKTLYPPEHSELEAMLERVKKYLPNAQIRGE